MYFRKALSVSGYHRKLWFANQAQGLGDKSGTHNNVHGDQTSQKHQQSSHSSKGIVTFSDIIFFCNMERINTTGEKC